ncbi:MAG: hypothetical protein PHE53_04680 [Thermoguttaceae bacterium]|nr:hypothetical protein [Thermoguttaceae bacterium]
MPLSGMWLALLACYLIVFLIESGVVFYAHQLIRRQHANLNLWRRKQRRSRFLLWLMAVTIFLHTVLLVERLLASSEVGVSFFALRQNWYFTSAFAFALAYFVYLIRWPGKRFGLFLYAAILLFGIGLAASSELFVRPPASRWLGIIHGVALVGTTLAIFGGMFIGMMFRVQRRRLKRVHLPEDGDEYPSLEWLHRDLLQCFNAATWMMVVGLCSGMLLIRLGDAVPAEQVVSRAEVVSTEPLVWYDPLVLGCATLTLWLVTCQLLIRYLPGWGNSTRLIRMIDLSSLFYLGMLAIIFWNATRHGGAIHTISPNRAAIEREAEPSRGPEVTQERIQEPRS